MPECLGQGLARLEDMDPTDTFPSEEGEISYLATQLHGLAGPSDAQEYFQRRHGLTLQRKQPLLYCPFRAKQEVPRSTRCRVCREGLSTCRNRIPYWPG